MGHKHDRFLFNDTSSIRNAFITISSELQQNSIVMGVIAVFLSCLIYNQFYITGENCNIWYVYTEQYRFEPDALNYVRNSGIARRNVECFKEGGGQTVIIHFRSFRLSRKGPLIVLVNDTRHNQRFCWRYRCYGWLYTVLVQNGIVGFQPVHLKTTQFSSNLKLSFPLIFQLKAFEIGFRNTCSFKLL